MKISKSVLLLALTLITNIQANSVFADEANNRLSAGVLIAQVISGTDFSGQEVRISGTALSKTSTNAGLLSLATQKTYQSGNYENFVSVYGVPVDIARGSSVEILAKIDKSSATKMGDKVFVTIEATYLRCIRC